MTNTNKYNLIFFIILFCSLIFYIIFNNYLNYTLIHKFLIIGICILNLLPFLFFLTNEREQNFVPVFYLALAYFFLCYTIFFSFDLWHFFTGAISDGEMAKIGNYEKKDMRLCLNVFFLGILFFNIGYFALYKFLNTSREGFTFLKIKDSRELLVIALLVYLFVIIMYYFLRIDKIIPGLAQIKYPLNYLTIGLIFLFTLRQKELALYKKIILYSLISLIIFIELLSGSFAYSFLILIFLYVVYFNCTKKIVILPIIIGCLIFIFIHSFKVEYRALNWLGINLVDGKRTVEPNMIEKRESFFKSMSYFSQKFYEADLNGKIDTLKVKTFYRVFHSAESLRVVTKFTPKHIPYWEGYSYKILLTKLVPRAFWKNKPSDTLGNDFGHRYKILNSWDDQTSWNMPVLNEFYVNFGIAGVSFGMFLLGLFFRLITNFFSVNNKNNYGTIIGVITIFPIFFLESHLSLLLGAVLQTFVFLIIFILIMKNFLRLIYSYND